MKETFIWLFDIAQRGNILWTSLFQEALPDCHMIRKNPILEVDFYSFMAVRQLSLGISIYYMNKVFFLFWLICICINSGSVYPLIYSWSQTDRWKLVLTHINTSLFIDKHASISVIFGPLKHQCNELILTAEQIRSPNGWWKVPKGKKFK